MRYEYLPCICIESKPCLFIIERNCNFTNAAAVSHRLLRGEEDSLVFLGCLKKFVQKMPEMQDCFMMDVFIMIDKWPLPRFKLFYVLHRLERDNLLSHPYKSTGTGMGEGELEPRKDWEMEGRGHLQIKEHEA